MVVLPLINFMLDGNKRSYTLNTIQQSKDADLFKFMCRFGTTHHDRANKIHVHGSPFYPVRNY